MHAGFTAVAKRFLLGRTEQQRADRQKGLEIWTPEQLQALWPFLKEQIDDDSPPDAGT